MQPALNGQDPVLQTLNDQIAWYDREAGRAQQWYRVIKVAELALATSVPPLAALGADTAIVTVVSSVVVLLVGLQHLFQFHANWISYRSTCEALRQEQFLFVAKAGPYAAAADARLLLAERFQSLVANENTSWASVHRPAAETHTAQTTPTTGTKAGT
jgi:hypothetical protein